LLIPAWLGAAWPGSVRRGLARQGMAGQGFRRRHRRSTERKGKQMKLAIEKIVIDEGIYPRSSVNEFNVGKLLSALSTSTVLPPVTVEAKTFRLVDGRHRYEAYKRKGLKTIEVNTKVYKNEADLFADAVRSNISHGQPLDSYTVRSAIIRLTEYGYSKDAISDVVRMPLEQIDKIERGYANEQASGKPMALKGGLSHLKGMSLTPRQIEINRHYGGGKATFYVRQLCDLLENDMAPRSDSFVYEMNKLVQLWLDLTSKEQQRKTA
jgi:ParB-like nuclease domain